MNILVTGAAGFIGSKVAEKLIELGNQVVTIDNLSTGKEKNIPKECFAYIGDDYDDNVVKELDKHSFDAIIHIAGQSSGEVSFEDPEYDMKTNILSTLKLLEYAKKTGCKKFIFASSMSVYGDQENPYVDENSNPKPKSFYAVGKLASENYMRIFSEYNIQCTALRFFNVYGIGQNMDNLKQGMASIYLALAITDKKILVKGSKDRFRDFVYIDDVVNAVICALNRKKGNMYECYNVSTGKKTHVETIIDTIIKALPYDVEVKYIDGTPGDQHGIYGDNAKIKNELDWQSCIDFETGMNAMINWALQENQGKEKD